MSKNLLSAAVVIGALKLLLAKKELHLKMSSAEVICCKKLHNITDELSIEANSMDPEQIGAV